MLKRLVLSTANNLSSHYEFSTGSVCDDLLAQNGDLTTDTMVGMLSAETLRR